MSLTCTATQAARLLGMGTSTFIDHVEKGTLKPPISMVRAGRTCRVSTTDLARALGITTADLDDALKAAA